MPTVYVGTSGWHYRHWVGPFYPEGTASEDFLCYYAEHFTAAEINNSFYQLPAPDTLAHWRDRTPRDFRFACKASRYITHTKKLKDPQQSTERFLQAVELLGEKLGPLLFQLPPHWRANADRLDAFLEPLSGRHRCVFEFRDHSWFRDEIYAVLRRHNAAFCIYDLAVEQSPVELTADFVYLRLHGPDGAYQGSYDGRTLWGWARRIAGWQADGRDVYCFFDNDEKGYAAQDALRLKKQLEAD